MWEFLSQFTGTAAGQIAVFVLLAILVVAVIQFVRGDWKIIRTKDSKMIFTTAQQRTSYDTSKSTLKLIQQHIAADAEKFEELRKEKAGMDAVILERLDKVESGLIDKKEILGWRRDMLILTFYSDEIRNTRPCEALRAGIKYIKAGGNGEVKEDVLAYCKEHSELYRGLQAGNAACRLEELKIGVDV
jgi:hypothetical protein